MFDVSELDQLSKDLIRSAEQKVPKEAEKFIRREGQKLATRMKRNYRSDIKNSKTGNLLRGVTRGRPYTYNGDEKSIRVYNRAPHAPLFEKGHDIKDPGDYMPEIGKRFKKERADARGTAGRTVNDFKKEFITDADKWVDELLDKGLF